MRLSSDLREFLELLNSRGVDYVVVGAHSLAFHGRPRYTGDIDILVRATPKNAAKLVDLLNEFGFADSGFKESDFTEPEQLVLADAQTSGGLLIAAADPEDMRLRLVGRAVQAVEIGLTEEGEPGHITVEGRLTAD